MPQETTGAMFDRDLLAGQRILVTGGATGLGAAIAEQMLSLGSDIVICGRRKARCDAAAALWREHFPTRRIETFGIDISNPTAVEDMVDDLWQSGGLTGLVNNAAGNFISPTEKLSSRAFDSIVNIVFHGTFYVTNAVGKRWIADSSEVNPQSKPFRSILSIITTWVDNGSPYVVPSAMSKAGIDVMTKSLAVEWARFGIRLNAVGPGEIPTEGMTKRLNPGALSGAATVLSANNPMGRMGRLEELQNLVAFLMAPGRCDWLTGQSIMMDGGNALANGGNFFELRSLTDQQWVEARQLVEAQNRDDRLERQQA